ncbi:hypothetical protein PINS_up006402 [Pythium insidiosum]|nr:hypothetical protein PINS_up006402 [Pythium insidiosum]
MEARYNRRISKKALTKWVGRTPIARDFRFIRDLSERFYSMKLCERVFKCGFVVFWTLTAGARKTAMAIRVQRMFRSRRARLRLFAMRMKIQYQLAARVSLGLDVRQYTFETLFNALKTQLWTFVLMSLPWQPVTKDARTAFLKTATSLCYIRKLPFEFGEADATELAPTSRLNHPPDLDPSYACELSLASWVGMGQHEIPCIVAFWQGIHSIDALASRTMKPQSVKPYWTLSRRFRQVCAANSAPTLRFSLSTDGGAPVRMTDIINWIETLIRSSRDAAAIDVQACVRRFLATRRLKRMLAVRRVRQSQRICQWIVQLKIKWRNAKEYASSIKIQRWLRGVWRRREFWLQLRSEMKRHRTAAVAIQRVVRRRSVRKRFQVALSSLLSTPTRYPYAPLCESCIGIDSEKPLFSLARLRCRGCQEVYCAPCFWKTHKSAKRMRHVCDTIDIQSMNSPTTVMCPLCEVHGASRQCWDCQPPGELMCLSCFELKHTDHDWSRSVLGQEGEGSIKAWWESSAFQTHQWARVDGLTASIQAPTMTTSQEVKIKHKWTTLDDIRRQHEAQAASEQLQREREEQLLAVRLQHESILRDAFERYDADKSGSIDRNEFKRMFREELCQPLTDGQVDEAFKVMDKSGNGLVEFDELLAWFTEDILSKSADPNSKDTPSLSLLKEALKAKKKMRRYKDKLNEFLPSLQKGNHDSGEAVLPPRPKVPGFPAVECIEHADFAKKRRVFMRFLQEVCGLSWVVEDEKVIPVANAMEMFDRVFLPRWNAGQLTYDFYFDDESFEFEGEVWTRRWNTATRKYEFCTTRVKKSILKPDETINRKRKRGFRRTISETPSASDVLNANEFTEESVEIVETIDPRRKQMLLDDAMRAFKKADTDSSGFIDTAEFHRMLNIELCEPVSKAKARQVMKQLDADGSGKIDFHEFFQWYAVEKCQDYPVTPQMERARALLRTRRRVQATALGAIEKGVSGGLKLKAAIVERRKAQRFAQDCKGASHELIELLQEGFDKALAQKALSLHDQDVSFARQWLKNREDQIRQEREASDRERADRMARRRREAKERAIKRRQKLTAARRHIKLLLFGPSKKEAHAARLEQALVNLDREVRMVERQLTMRTKRLNGAM